MTRASVAARARLPELGDRLDVADVGGKAAVLDQLVRWGFAVPPAVVIPNGVFERWLAATGLTPQIERSCAGINPRQPETAKAAAANIEALVSAARFTDEVEAVLADACDRLLAVGPLAVRSSAVGEDGATASFAGQLDSILHVTDATGVAAAVRRCWTSYWSERALWYRAAREAPLSGMGVVIQRQIHAIESGVVFTRDPQGADAMLIEWCAGLADDLVSGRVDPWRRLVPRDRADADDVARVAAAIEARAGRPQDIEWARDASNRIWIVQARPITTPPGAATPPPRHVWSNANVSENFPSPISPLLYSIASVGYYHYFRNLGLAFGVSRRRLRAMDRPLRTIVGAHGARLYYNLTNIHAVLRMAPCGDALARAFNTFVGVEEMASPPPGAITWSDRRRRFTQAVELARIVASTSWQYAWFRRRLQSFEQTVDAFAAETTLDHLATESLSILAAHLERFIEIRCDKWKNASLADAAAMVCYALLEQTLAAAGAPGGAMHRLLRALPGVPSSQPPLRLWTLSRLIREDAALRDLFQTSPTPTIETRLRTDADFAAFAAEFDRYLEDWGFRSSSELMLTTPTLQERPAPVIDLLRQYATRDSTPPEAAMAAQAADRRTETRALLRSTARRAPHLALALWVLLRWTHRAIAFRERARLKQALLYTRCRHIALAVGDRLTTAGLLAAPDEVFLLTWQEIADLAAGRAMLAGGTASLVALRRGQHAELARTTPPDRFVLEEGATIAGGGVVPGDQGVDPPSRDLRGIGASAGRTTARAAVLGDVAEAHRLRDGDILVTRQTDPGWGPVFCLVSGLVIERGGMLSHGAIIAREFGLPCVVGIAGATARIGHGDRLTVDGTAGTCRIEALADAETA